MRFTLLGIVLLLVPFALAADGDTGSVSKVWNNVEVGDVIIGEFRTAGLSFRDVTLVFAERADPAKIEVQGRATKPVLAPESGMARIYQYVDITTNIGERASVREVLFHLPREWFESLTIENPGVALEHRVGNNWTTINFSVTESEDWLEVRASISVLDDFVIGANRPLPAEVVPESDVAEHETVQESEPVDVAEQAGNNGTAEISPAVGQDNSQALPGTSRQPTTLPVWMWIVLGALVALALLVFVFERTARRRKREFA